MLRAAMNKLTRPTLEASIRESMAGYPGADGPMIDRTVDWVMHLRKDLVGLLASIGDDEQIVETLAINYIELKTRWIALNTKTNYQLFRTGSSEPEVALRGFACSALLADVEALLSADDITKITEFLSTPVSRAA
jgi:hypothetical protein